MKFKTNVSDKPRTTEVKITDGDMVTTMKITQEALFFIVNNYFIGNSVVIICSKEDNDG